MRDTGDMRWSARGLRALAVLAALLAFATITLAAGVSPASAITRNTVLARAQTWIDKQVPYSQTKWIGPWRTDCSGYVSMCWAATSGGHSFAYSTRSLHVVSHPITADELLPGDALLRAGHHVRLFYGWADQSHTSYMCYEQSGPGMRSTIKVLASDIASGYIPVRYDKITDSPKPWNALVNPTFDVWAAGWPVWWSAHGDDTSFAHRTDLAHTSLSSLGLANPSSRTRDVVELSQTSSVASSTPYRLSMWAASDSAAGALQLKLQFLDADGHALTSVTTSAGAGSLETSTFGMMSISATAPAAATSATVSVRLLGGINTTGAVGTNAVVDDVWLYDASPVESTCTVSKGTTTVGHAIVLRGRVAAPIPIGTVRLYVTKPGSKTAAKLSDRPLIGGAWSFAYMPKLHGTYRFTAKYLGYGPFGPVSSPLVTLKAK